MASSSTLSSLVFSHHFLPNNPSKSPLLPFSTTSSHNPPRIRRPSIEASSSNSRRDAYVIDEKTQLLLERYGIDPSELEPRRDKKSRRKREEVEKQLPEETKAPRTTHKLLQVLGGKARRKKLLSPKGMDVRPMMEVVKGAAFGILQVAGGSPAFLRPGRWLDLYSGTGSVGIEAISRGCSEVHFVEMDPWVVTEVLRPNLEWTGFLDVSVIHRVRVESFLEQAEHSLCKDGPFDYISVTPPYTAVDYSILMEQLAKSCLVGKDTFILVEYPLGTAMLDSCGCLVKVADRRFGRTHLAVYGPTWSQKKRK
ncbi:hypothetical protein QJS10_CPA10g00288 [Acorus calamus]|uniref:rRNA methyltransferase YlbH n=1 Tax=Acorus calamus TaxID=4465 RepID=A0AAV9E244_ACOCL|nr:hypothetical protein QJS10_CPA10g00288 [Acorus calamus]